MKFKFYLENKTDSILELSKSCGLKGNFLKSKKKKITLTVTIDEDDADYLTRVSDLTSKTKKELTVIFNALNKLQKKNCDISY